MKVLLLCLGAPDKASPRKWQNVPYREDVATHSDPESFARTGKGVREALTGASVGRLLSSETELFGMPTLSRLTEGNLPATPLAPTSVR